MALSFEMADGQVSGDVLRDPNMVQALLKLYAETNPGPMPGMPVSEVYMPCVDSNGPISSESIQELLDHHLSQYTSPALKQQYTRW